jgi:preprotein translocase SecF subunit
MQFFRDTHIGFVNLRHKAYILSGALILIGIVALVIRGGLNLSIDFEGGTLIQVKFDQHVPANMLRDAVTRAGFNNAKIQDFGESNEYLITVEKISETAKASEILMRALNKTSPAAGWKIVSTKEMPPDLSKNFEGGNLVVVEASKMPPLDELKAGVIQNGVGFMEATKQSENRVAFSLPFLGIETEAAENMKAEIAKTFPDRVIDIRRTETVGPKIGEELKNRMWAAILISLCGILVYISWRFEFKFAVGAVVALIHDVVITVGIFSILDKEISIVVIAALLTIVGYSLNDTIVVFDRIRENFSLRRRESYDNMVDISINETLGRTVNTSLTTLLVIFSLFFLGGEVIHDFAFAILIGVVVGTYSSIFVASPIVVEWQHRITERTKVKQA